MNRARRYLGWLGLLVGCAPGAPADPTWIEDVRPILQANCVRCHYPPPLNGAPAGFRLDVFGDVINPDGSVTRGAGTMAQFVSIRAGELGEMPPDWPLSDYQRDVLRNWCADGKCASQRPEEGARRGNRAPVVTVDPALPASSDGEPVEIRYRIDDPDGDLVHGAIRLVEADPASALPGQIVSGTGTLIWDSGASGPGTYTLVAVVSDGTEEVRVTLGTVEVDPPGGNTAPVPVLEFPGPDEVLVDADSPHEINVAVTDPDPGDAVTFDAEAFRGNEVVAIATGIATTPSPGNPALRRGAVAWTTDDLAAAANWRLRVTARDGTTSRTVTSGYLIVSHAAAAPAFASAQEVFSANCTYCCHGGGAPGPGNAAVVDLIYNFGVHASNPPEIGAYDARGLIYRRVVQSRDMPPPIWREAAEALCGEGLPLPPGDMTEAERAAVAAWILGGGAP